MTQLELAKKGKISPQMEAVARVEKSGRPILSGKAWLTAPIVIPRNVNHRNLKPLRRGRGTGHQGSMPNIGTSSRFPVMFPPSWKKLQIAIDAGARHGHGFKHPAAIFPRLRRGDY